MNYKRGIKFLTSKKAMDIELWFNVFELVIVFSAGLVLLDTVNSEARGTAFEKNYLARDSALLINTIYASPGDIEYYYPNQTSGFIFDFKKNKVGVYEQYEATEGGAVEYPFAEDTEYTFFYTRLSPRNLQEHKIVYSKSKDSIKVNN